MWDEMAGSGYSLVYFANIRDLVNMADREDKLSSRCFTLHADLLERVPYPSILVSFSTRVFFFNV